ncbi:unnamed protein product [Eretmochelys imbricata]
MLLWAQCSADSEQAAQRGQEDGEEIWQHVTSRRGKGRVHVPAVQIQKNREVCCLPGTRIHDVTERLSRLISPSDRYPFLLLHVGTSDTAKNDIVWITADYMALGRRIKEFEAQVVFSSILPVEGKGLGRDRRIVEVKE